MTGGIMKNQRSEFRTPNCTPRPTEAKSGRGSVRNLKQLVPRPHSQGAWHRETSSRFRGAWIISSLAVAGRRSARPPIRLTYTHTSTRVYRRRAAGGEGPCGSVAAAGSALLQSFPPHSQVASENKKVFGPSRRSGGAEPGRTPPG